MLLHKFKEVKLCQVTSNQTVRGWWNVTSTESKSSNEDFLSSDAALLYEYTLKNYPNEIKKKINVQCKELHDIFIEECLRKRYADASAKRYVSVLKVYIFPFFDDLYTTKISGATLKDFANYVNKLKYKDKANVFFIAKVFLQFLYNFGTPAFEFSQFFYVYKSNKDYDQEESSWDCYSLDEFLQFYSAIDDVRDRLIFSLMFFYGLRKGEIPMLKHSDFTPNSLSIKRAMTTQGFEKGQKRKSTKTKSSRRTYPRVDIVFTAYEELLKSDKYKRDPEYVFPSSHKGKVIGFSSIDRKNRYYAQKSGLRRIKIHWFRHSCATYLINSGMDYMQVSAWLGHSSPDVTLRVYAHLYLGRKLEIASFIDKQIKIIK